MPKYLILLLDSGINVSTISRFTLSSYIYWWVALIVPVLIHFKIMKAPKLKSNYPLMGILFGLLVLVISFFSLSIYSLYSIFPNAVF